MKLAKRFLFLLICFPSLSFGASLYGLVEWSGPGFGVVDGRCVQVKPESSSSKMLSSLKGKKTILGGVWKENVFQATRVRPWPEPQSQLEKTVLGISRQMEMDILKNGGVSLGPNFTLGLDANPARLARATRILMRVLPPYLYEQHKRNPIRLYIYNDFEWNAFSLIHGVVFLSVDLFDALDDDELAFLIGHELAHIFQKDSVAKNKRLNAEDRTAQLAKYLSWGVPGGIFVDEYVKDSVTRTFRVVSNSYSRAAEDRADRLGMRYAHMAGYDVSKVPGVWEKFVFRYPDKSKLEHYFNLASDHSRSVDRLALAKAELLKSYSKPNVCTPR